MKRKFRLIAWYMPKDLYERLELCHNWAQKNMLGVPISEESFGLTVMEDGIKAFENLMKKDSLIVVPTPQVDVSKIRS